jgi:hypothetical protein
MRKSTTALAALAALVAAGVMAIPATVAGAAAGSTIYVGPHTIVNDNNHSCTNTGYATIGAAVTAAPAGSTIIVCAGTYNEQVTIGKSHLTVKTQGHATVAPTTVTAYTTDLDTSQPMVAIVDVTPAANNVNISGLWIDGTGIEAGVNGCSDNLVGVLDQASASHAVSGKINGLHVKGTTPTNSGCGAGLGIFVQSAMTGTAKASLDITNNNVSGYGKNGVTCADLGTVCAITGNTITTSPTGAVAQNGVQVGFGASGSVTTNHISGNQWTSWPADTSNPQMQSDGAAGVLLYAAGVNAAGVTTITTSVHGNILAGNDIGVELVDSAASVTNNTIGEVSPGLVDSIGIYGVGCDDYCGYFNWPTSSSPHTLNSLASSQQHVKVTNNTINFAASPAGSYGVWLGDNSWSAGSGYFGPAGFEIVIATPNSITHVVNPLTIGGGA